MKNIKTIRILTVLIIVLSLIAGLTGIFSSGAKQYPDVVSTFGETIKLYNKGLYARDSVSMANQAIGQDIVTVIVGVPLLVVSLLLLNKKKAKGTFLLTGTIGYFLYTYTSYSFLSTYNHFYLIYVALMALSFYGFILCINTINEEEIWKVFSRNFPVKPLSIFFWVVGLVIGLMWLGRIYPTILSDTAPYGLEQYSTLGIQTLDLGFIVPAAFISGYLLRKESKWGYIFSVVLVIKAVTMAAAISSMVVVMRINGISGSIVENFMFPTILVICLYFMNKLFKEIKE